MRILKQGSLVALLCGFAGPSFGLCGYETYVGFGIGPEAVVFRQKAVIINRPPNGGNPTSIIDKNEFGGEGGFLSLLAGIGTRFSLFDSNCDNFYLAAEINANSRTLKRKLTNEEFNNFNFSHTYYQMRRDLGISLLPGIFFSDCTLFYARLGYANGRFIVDTTDTSLQNIRRSLNGFRYGFGFRQALNACWAFRIEYNQVTYQKANMFTFDPVGNTRKSTSITPHTKRFEFAVLYTF